MREPHVTSSGLHASVYRRVGGHGVARNAVVAIGQFDGVHLGHQALLSEAVHRAGVGGPAGSRSGAITFDRHPMSLLAPGREPAALTGLEEKVGLLLASGVDFVVVLHLTPELLATGPKNFVDDVLVDALGVRGVVVGPNFRFGSRAAGDPSLLAGLGSAHGFDVHCPALTNYGHSAVSSTRIRAAIAAGDIDGAVSMLGRPLAGHLETEAVVELLGDGREWAGQHRADQSMHAATAAGERGL